MISIAGLDKALVLAALYNAAKPQGMGFLQYDPEPMTRDEAAATLGVDTYFDYLKGRVMKVDLSRDEFDPRLYDRDNGHGAAEAAVNAVRTTGHSNPAEIQAAHHVNTLAAADDAEGRLGTKSVVSSPGVVEVGLGDVAGPLSDKLRDARKALRGDAR